jgi:hypothetical protein
MGYVSTNHKHEFKTDVSIDNGYTNEHQGVFDQTFELFKEDRRHYMIEWDIPAMNETEHIGMTFDEDLNLMDYDGVFEFPKEAIAWLEGLNLGFNLDYVKD